MAGTEHARGVRPVLSDELDLIESLIALHDRHAFTNAIAYVYVYPWRAGTEHTIASAESVASNSFIEPACCVCRIGRGGMRATGPSRFVRDIFTPSLALAGHRLVVAELSLLQIGPPHVTWSHLDLEPCLSIGNFEQFSVWHDGNLAKLL